MTHSQEEKDQLFDKVNMIVQRFNSFRASSEVIHNLRNLSISYLPM